MIVFSVRQWQGKYWSRDIPHGVDTTPHTSAIFRLPSLGGEPCPVTKAGGQCSNPQYSPDGKWVYFQAMVDGHWDILRCREDGARQTNLTRSHAPPGDRYGYRIASDGAKLVFAYFDGRQARVGIMTAAGSRPRLIAPDLDYHYMADISPDSQSVVFAHAARGYPLVLARLDTGRRLVLTPGLPGCICPQFTADGAAIVFAHTAGDIYRVDVDGGNLRQLTEGNDYCTFRLSPDDAHGSSDFPSLSPDGRQIAYIGMKDVLSQVHVMNIDGSEQRQITFRRTACGRAKFSRDGRQIAFVSWVDDYAQLFIMPTAGGEPQQLTEVQGAVCFCDWKPL